MCNLARARASSSQCSVCFAHLRGFSKLAEKYNAEGSGQDLSTSNKALEGAERMRKCLNSYFGAIVDAMDAEGGDVVKFAGDALMGVWRPPSPARWVGPLGAEAP